MERERIEAQVREFLNGHYNDATAPAQDAFEDELLDIADEAEELGSFEAWRQKYGQQQAVRL